MNYKWLCTRQHEDGLWWIYSFNLLLKGFGGFTSQEIAEEVICAIYCKDEIKHLMNK